MRLKQEIKRISVDNHLVDAEIHVVYTLKDYRDIKQFKEKLSDFLLYLEGQTKLTKK